jgi:hypothetical protein
MFAFLERGAPAIGRVLFPGTIPPPLDQLQGLAPPVTVRTLPASEEQVWAVEASHPVWGAAQVACARQPAPLASVHVDHTLALSDEEKARARQGAATVAVRVATATAHVLRDRKRLLHWLGALMRPDGVIAVDEGSTLLWSQAMLDDELLHPADLDVESLYAIHAVRETDEDPTVSWLHTHGLEDLQAFDVDVVNPSPLLTQNCGEFFRALAFAALEGAIAPSTDRFRIVHPGGDVRFVPAERFQAEAAPEHAAVRQGGIGHGGRRAVLCDPAGGLLGRWRTRPTPSRFLSRLAQENIVVPFSTAATNLMAERARQTFGVFRELKEEFASLELPAVVKLGYAVEGGGPNDREHLWFEVHHIVGDKVDATLANTPHRVPSLTAGQRGEHDLERLTDWTILSPEGPMTPRNIGAARRLRVTRAEWQARIDAARDEPGTNRRP